MSHHIGTINDFLWNALIWREMFYFHLVKVLQMRHIHVFFKKSVHLSSKRMEVMFRFHFMAGHFHTLVDDWLITNGKHSLNWYFLTWADWKLLENSSVNVVSPCHLFMSKSIFIIVDVHSENVNLMLAVFHKVWSVKLLQKSHSSSTLHEFKIW